MSEQTNVGQDVQVAIAQAGRLVDELAAMWSEAKTLGCEVAHIIDAVEAGDSPAQIMAVVRECFPRKNDDGKVVRAATLPGQRPDLALRYARARRKQSGA